jgi:hypothetical protein
MVKRKIMLGIFGVALVFGLIPMGCDTNTSNEPNTDPKTIVITGFDLYVEGFLEIAIREELDGPKTARIGIGGGIPGSDPRDASAKLIDMDTTATGTHPENGEQPWTGTGNYFISFDPDAGGSNSVKYYYSVDDATPSKYYIKDAVTKLAFAKFVKKQN